jgi:hypothetical protein
MPPENRTPPAATRGRRDAGGVFVESTPSRTSSATGAAAPSAQRREIAYSLPAPRNGAAA